jgi:hypothetical protein
VKPIVSRGWKFDRGWQIRARSRSGAETSRKVKSYEEAMTEAETMAETGQYREVWVEEVEAVLRKWRDLEPDKRRREPTERSHVTNTEEWDS